MQHRLTKYQQGVVDEEVLDAPGPEAAVTVEEHDEQHPAKTDVSRVRLEPSTVRECMPVDVLSLDRAPEEDVRDAHDDVVYNATSGDQVYKPAKHVG